MSVITTAVIIVLTFAGLQQGQGQKDSVENWRLSFTLCEDLKNYEIYRFMRLDVNCYQHVGLYQDQLCVQVIIH